VEYDVEGIPKLDTLLAEGLSGRASIFILFGEQSVSISTHTARRDELTDRHLRGTGLAIFR
jgi:hypothetical protein